MVNLSVIKKEISTENINVKYPGIKKKLGTNTYKHLEAYNVFT